MFNESERRLRRREEVCTQRTEGSKGVQHGVVVVLQERIGLGGAGMVPDRDGLSVHRRERSPQAVSVGSSTPYRAPGSTGRQPWMRGTNQEYDGSSLAG